MKAGLTALFLLAAASLAFASGDGEGSQTLDVSGVTAIEVKGEASAIDLSTTDGVPYRADLGARRSGWFARWRSSWFLSDCRMSSRMRIEGSTLHVDVASSSWLDVSGCTVELKANVRPETAVSIRQAATQAKLTGDFAAVVLDAKAADISLDGHAEAVSLKADAIRSHLVFARITQGESVTIDAESLDAYLGFAAGTRISYSVTAAASLVDSALPNTTGAKPSLAINGRYVRATIR